MTNTYNPGKITIRVEKKWNDNDNQDGIRPALVGVNLIKDGKKIDDCVLNAADRWVCRFDELDKYEGTDEIRYSVEEIYDQRITESTDGPGTYALEDIDYKVDSGFVITNKHTPETVEVSGKKTWNDDDDVAGLRPESITINLHADGRKIESKKVTADDGWSWTWTNLDKYENGRLFWTRF